MLRRVLPSLVGVFCLCLTAAADAQSSAAAGQAPRPNVVERPWTTTPGSPYDRAQAVAAERVNPDTALYGTSPYPDEYRSPVPAPFRPAALDQAWPATPWLAAPFRARPARREWRGGELFPGLWLPAIRFR